MRRVLVTGAGTWTGGRLIQRLERRAHTEVFATDSVPPRLGIESPFHLAEPDTLDFAHYLLELKPTVVVHLQTVDRAADIGTARAHDAAVIGAQTLAGAVARCPAVEHVVVKSDVIRYGVGPRNASVVTEDADPAGSRSRFARDLVEMEGAFIDVADRHGIPLTVLRFAGIIGTRVDNPMSRFLTMPIVPKLLGFDPRLQFLHEDDAVRAIEHAVIHRMDGAVNVAAPGLLYLSQLLRLGRRLPQPLPQRGFDASLRTLARAGRPLPPHFRDLIRHGLVVDTTRMTMDLGFAPRLTCRQAVLAMFERIDAGRVDARGRR